MGYFLPITSSLKKICRGGGGRRKEGGGRGDIKLGPLAFCWLLLIKGGAVMCHEGLAAAICPRTPSSLPVPGLITVSSESQARIEDEEEEEGGGWGSKGRSWEEEEDGQGERGGGRGTG